MMVRNIDKKVPLRQVKASLHDGTKLKKLIRADDVVIHLACTTVPSTSQANYKKDIQENVFGTLNLLDACISAKVRKFIFMSSGGTVYGETRKLPIKESHPAHPVNAHGIMKLTVEKYIYLYHHLFGLNYLIIRGANFYGRQRLTQYQQGIIDVFLHKLLRGEPLEVWGDGNTVRDYVYIKDVTSFLLKAASFPVYNETVNLGTGKGTSIRQIIKTLKRVMRKEFHVSYHKKRNFDVRRNILDIHKAKSLFHWQPRYTVQEGIQDMYNSLKNKTK